MSEVATTNDELGQSIIDGYARLALGRLSLFTHDQFEPVCQLDKVIADEGLTSANLATLDDTVAAEVGRKTLLQRLILRDTEVKDEAVAGLELAVYDLTTALHNQTLTAVSLDGSKVIKSYVPQMSDSGTMEADIRHYSSITGRVFSSYLAIKGLSLQIIFPKQLLKSQRRASIPVVTSNGTPLVAIRFEGTI